MARFFIDRPVFAWVLAIFIMLAGALAIPRLAVERYPAVAPPSVSIYASYPGASPQTLNDAVVGLIERELSSVKHLLYFESSVDTSGEASITATFKPGTNPELAQVDVQNRLKAIEPRLPQRAPERPVRGGRRFGFLMLVGLPSPDGSVARPRWAITWRATSSKSCAASTASAACSCSVPSRRCASGSTRPADRLRPDHGRRGRRHRAAEPADLAGRIGDSPGVPGQRITVPLTSMAS
jgi:multidrug efflux pump